MGVALACIGDSRNVYRMVAKPEKKNLLEDLGLDGRIILRWIVSKLDLRAWTRIMWLMIG
jgi:hypothetical protein